MNQGGGEVPGGKEFLKIKSALLKKIQSSVFFQMGIELKKKNKNLLKLLNFLKIQKTLY